MLQLRLPLNKDLRNIGVAISNTLSSGAVLSQANNAYQFDGTDDYISVDGIADCFKGGTNPFSVSFWFYHSGNSRRGVLFGDYGLVSSNRINLEITAANKLRFWWDGSPDWTCTNFTLTTQTWYHCVFVYDGSSVKLYINGELSDTRNGALTAKTPSGNYYLGRDVRTGATAFYGMLRDFRVYDHALSIKEIKELSLGLFLHYKFDSVYEDFYKLDYSGFDHKIVQKNGTLQLQGDSEKYSDALKLNGSTGFISEEFYTPQECTYCMWVKKTSGSSTGFFIDARKANTGVQPIYTSSTTLQVYSSTGGSNNYSIAIPSNTWQHYTVVLTTTGNKVYVNGELAASGTVAKGMNVLTYITIAMRHSQATYLTGAVNDVRMYFRALTDQEILKLYKDTIMIDKSQNGYVYELNENNSSTTPNFKKNGQLMCDNYSEVFEGLYLPINNYVDTGVNYGPSDVCKVETFIKYDANGSGRDLMGFSPTSGGYWGVRAAGTWEPHGTFSYTDADITHYNRINYEYTCGTNDNGGNWRIGCLSTDYVTRSKTIYRVRMWKNGVFVRDLFPFTQGSQNGLVDALTGTFYPVAKLSSSATNSSIVANDREASIGKNVVTFNNLNEI